MANGRNRKLGAEGRQNAERQNSLQRIFLCFPFGLCVFNLIKIVYAVAHKFADRNSSSVGKITTKLRKFQRRPGRRAKKDATGGRNFKFNK